MKVCTVCGGKLERSYSAPEVQCKCTREQQKTLEDMRGGLLDMERKYLLRCGWRVTNDKFKSAKEGFFWFAKNGEGPMSQTVAYSTQKEWDLDPVRQEWMDLSCRYNEVKEKMRNQDVSNPSETLRQQLEAVIMDMRRITEKRPRTEVAVAGTPTGN